jgi:hypothetical protein
MRDESCTRNRLRLRHIVADSRDRLRLWRRWREIAFAYGTLWSPTGEIVCAYGSLWSPTGEIGLGSRVRLLGLHFAHSTGRKY